MSEKLRISFCLSLTRGLFGSSCALLQTPSRVKDFTDFGEFDLVNEVVKMSTAGKCLSFGEFGNARCCICKVLLIFPNEFRGCWKFCTTEIFAALSGDAFGGSRSGSTEHDTLLLWLSSNGTQCVFDKFGHDLTSDESKFACWSLLFSEVTNFSGNRCFDTKFTNFDFDSSCVFGCFSCFVVRNSSPRNDLGRLDRNLSLRCSGVNFAEDSEFSEATMKKSELFLLKGRFEDVAAAERLGCDVHCALLKLACTTWPFVDIIFHLKQKRKNQVWTT